MTLPVEISLGQVQANGKLLRRSPCTKAIEAVVST